MTKLLDRYFKNALLWDTLVIGVLIYVRHSTLMNIPLFTCPDKAGLMSNISDLINVSISLAGFVLASLTIIVTFKDSSASRPNVSSTGADLIFNSKHYSDIVKVFASSAFILLLTFVLLSCIKLLQNQFSDQVLLDIVAASIFTVSMSTLRSLFVLYNIIKLQIAS